MDANFVGQEIQGYKIMKPIGQGKFSTVYKAQNAEGQPVAVKKIKVNNFVRQIFDMMDPKQREKCLKQVDLMKPLSHPNIIKYIDSFTHNNELIIVTEWAEKGDLKRLIKDHQADETPLEQIRIWDFIIQISSALRHMHEKRIMHRDLKPANIFIAQDDSLKVGDLGLGRAFGSQTIEAHSKVGTPLYMSPELLRDEGYQANADVWSLGCIAYEFAELHSPFRNQNEKMSLMDLFNNITRGQYKPISNRYSPELADLIKHMIVVDPNQRLSSAEVLQISEENFNRLKKSPKIDCYIAMEDIITKLNLIDYTVFCKVTEHKPINKFYFAMQDTACEPNQQLFHFLELGYWLINLSKVDRSKEKAASQAKAMIQWKSIEGACNKFLTDMQAFGIKHEITAKAILQGYGQNVCYLLNQLLNRELIRVNFKFQVSEQPTTKNIEEEEYGELEVDEDMLVRHEPEKDDDIEETLEFERSMLFKRGKKPEYANDDKLLQKIKQIDEDDTNMIVGRADEKEWEKECLRVDKHLTAIGTALKQNRKRSGFDNFERIRHAAGRISDVIGYIKPSSYKLYEQTQKDCERILGGEKIINNNLDKLRLEFSEKNKQRRLLAEQLTRYTATANDRVQELQSIESKLESINNMITNVTSEDREQPVVRLRQAIQKIQKQLKEIEVNRGLLEWQVREYKKLEFNANSGGSILMEEEEDLNF